MKRKFVMYAFLLFATIVQAQTARQFTINLTDDGKANMVCFLADNPTGRAIVGIPGGGYSMLSNTHEGTQAHGWMNQQGISYFVVNYRLPNGDRSIPISDVKKGIRIVRDSAKVWNINPHDLGIMGFSAGGHLASVISTLSDFDVRPDFTILFYPVISMDVPKSHKWSCINFLGEEGHKDPKLIKKYSTNNAVRRHLTPPALIITASDDGLVNPVTNGLTYYKAMHDAGNECSLFVYPTGNHGFGFGPWFKYHDQLLSDLGNWLKNRPAPKADAIRVACIGNSITDGYGIDFAPANGYPAQLQQMLGDNYWVKNFGVSARTIVIIKLGTNDSKPENWQYGADFKQDLQQMITTLRPDLNKPIKKKGKKNIKETTIVTPTIMLCTPIKAFKPSWKISDSVIVNNIISIQQEVAKQYGLQVIDLHTLFGTDPETMLDDGIHPNMKGAKKIAEIVADAIKQNSK